MNIDFEEAVSEIRVAYRELGHNLGFRFLYSSRSTFLSKIIFMNLNPGGDRIPIDHPWDSCENGPAHITESWDGYLTGKHPLQIQVQKLFTLLSEKIPGEEELIYKALLTNFIPFRSKSFSELHAQDESIKFSIHLWEDILPIIQPRLIICTGTLVFDKIKEIYGAPINKFSVKLNWANITGEVYEYYGLRILHLPNLSRYKIFSHPASMEPINQLLEKATEFYKN